MTNHADEPRRRPSPTVQAAVAAIRGDDVHGASHLAREAIRAVGAEVEVGPTADRDEVLARARAAIESLAGARPEMAPIRVWLSRLQDEIDRIAASAASPDELRSAIVAAVNAIANQSEKAGRLAAETAATRLPPGSVVLTASDSTTIREAVRLARQVGRLRRLLVAASDDGRGHRYGEILARAVGGFGVPVEVVPDAAIDLRVATADRVWLGADTIYPDGGILNGSGSLAVARAAKARGKPVEVIAESAKVVERSPPPGQALPLGMDYVPGALISAIITEEDRPPPPAPSLGGPGEGEALAERRPLSPEGEATAGRRPTRAGEDNREAPSPPLPALSTGEGAGDDPAGLVAAIAEKLTNRGEQLAVAESAAGGQICDLLSDRPGSSAWLAGGILAYSNGSKRQVVGVPAETLAGPGTVSPEVARAMAEGARRLFGTAWGIGETGIAGPQTGRRSSKPAGLAYVSVVGPRGIDRIEEVQTGQDERRGNKRAFAIAALRLLDDILSRGRGSGEGR